MLVRNFLFRLCAGCTFVLTGSALAAAQSAAPGTVIANSTPAFVNAGSTVNLGPENPSTIVDVSLWLNLHNRSGFDALHDELYDPNSSNYRNWLKKEEFAARYAPTAGEAAQVSRYLASHGLNVVRVGPNNLFVHAQGTASAVAQAFHTTLNRYQVDGKAVRANATDPIIDDPATARLVGTVSGLNSAGFTHPALAASSVVPGQQQASGFSSSAAQPSAASDFNPNDIPYYCFPGPATESVGEGSYPYAVVKGNKYLTGVAGCGYIPSDIQTAYHLNALYKKGFDGTGQSIVIIDWCGSPTIESDANAFSARFGLPPLTSANFQTIEYPTKSQCTGEDAEINIDVEWAHAVAPGAHIVLLVPPTSSFADLDEAEYYAIVNNLGSVISGSYGASERYVDHAELSNENLINEIAGVFGIAPNFSTGDNGDGSFHGFQRPTIQDPASSPYATAVGGISLALNKDHTIAWQTGWGTNKGYVAQEGVPGGFSEGFLAGSTGGPSTFFAKPSYQSTVPGTMRQVPDISWLGDPYTGAVIVLSEAGFYPSQVFAVYGGTSLACPMFSALWAIANQEAGTRLGQAAPYLYSMPKGTITDIVPLGSSTNLIDTVWSSPTQSSVVTSNELLDVLQPKPYISAFYNAPLQQGTVFAVSFGTDSSLTITPGWDNVTGLGVPVSEAFTGYFNPGKKQ